MERIDKNFRAKKIFLLIAGMLTLSVSCASNQSPSDNQYSMPLRVNGRKIFVEIADSREEKQRGLSGREKLADSQGMLFDFTDAGGAARPGFWMKEMKFDLDLIWIRKGRIVGITPNVPHPKSPGEELPLYYPPADADMALEVNAGWSEKRGIKIGDEINY